jgi:antitoxin (DNA-binding transcriptional repressor) of toxin-antitoxin stability system
MKSVQLSDLGPAAEDVKNVEAVEVRDGNRVVATIVPLRQARLDELAAQG